MRTEGILATHVDDGKVEAIPQETFSESSTVGSSPRPTAIRNATNKSAVSKTPDDVDAILRILSRRSAGEQSGHDKYEANLENIMGGIFGHADDDNSKRKKVGVIWKNLTVNIWVTALIVG